MNNMLALKIFEFLNSLKQNKDALEYISKNSNLNQSDKDFLLEILENIEDETTNISKVINLIFYDAHGSVTSVQNETWKWEATGTPKEPAIRFTNPRNRRITYGLTPSLTSVSSTPITEDDYKKVMAAAAKAVGDYCKSKNESMDYPLPQGSNPIERSLNLRVGNAPSPYNRNYIFNVIGS